MNTGLRFARDQSVIAAEEVRKFIRQVDDLDVGRIDEIEVLDKPRRIIALVVLGHLGLISLVILSISLLGAS